MNIPFVTEIIFHPHVLKLFFLTTSGLLIRQSLVSIGQRWANTFHHLGTYLLLPSIAMIITSVIKDDIALSLGMIGALSIVRFRTPVKSPFELVIFFGLITLGIVAGVSLKISIMLLILLVGVTFGITIIEKISNYFGKNLTEFSFNEASQIYSIEITSKVKIKELENNKNLINFYFEKNSKEHFYRLVFKNKNDLNQIKDLLYNNEQVISIKTDLG